MKLTDLLNEYLVAYGPGLKFYGDPKNKDKGTDDTSFLTGGSKDKTRFTSEVTNKKKKKGKND